jgi:hypothetical protein
MAALREQADKQQVSRPLPPPSCQVLHTGPAHLAGPGPPSPPSPLSPSPHRLPVSCAQASTRQAALEGERRLPPQHGFEPLPPDGRVYQKNEGRYVHGKRLPLESRCCFDWSGLLPCSPVELPRLWTRAHYGPLVAVASEVVLHIGCAPCCLVSWETPLVAALVLGSRLFTPVAGGGAGGSSRWARLRVGRRWCWTWRWGGTWTAACWRWTCSPTWCACSSRAASCSSTSPQRSARRTSTGSGPAGAAAY